MPQIPMEGKERKLEHKIAGSGSRKGRHAATFRRLGFGDFGRRRRCGPASRPGRSTSPGPFDKRLASRFVSPLAAGRRALLPGAPPSGSPRGVVWPSATVSAAMQSLWVSYSLNQRAEQAIGAIMPIFRIPLLARRSGRLI
jgi:hypothetical protein